MEAGSKPQDARLCALHAINALLHVLERCPLPADERVVAYLGHEDKILVEFEVCFAHARHLERHKLAWKVGGRVPVTLAGGGHADEGMISMA